MNSNQGTALQPSPQHSTTSITTSSRPSPKSLSFVPTAEYLPPQVAVCLRLAIDAIYEHMYTMGLYDETLQTYMLKLREFACLPPMYFKFASDHDLVKLPGNIVRPYDQTVHHYVVVLPQQLLADLDKALDKVSQGIQCLDPNIHNMGCWHMTYWMLRNNSCGAVERSTARLFKCTSFELFKQLPNELQTAVWGFASMADSIVGLRESAVKGMPPSLIGSVVRSPLLSVCHLSRLVALQNRQPLYRSLVAGAPLQFLNLSTDILMLLDYKRINDRDPQPFPNPWQRPWMDSTLSLIRGLPQMPMIKRLALSYKHCSFNGRDIGFRLEYSLIFRMELTEIIFVIDEGVKGLSYNAKAILITPTSVPLDHPLIRLSRPYGGNTWASLAALESAHCDRIRTSRDAEYGRRLAAGATPEQLAAENLSDLSTWTAPKFVFKQLANVVTTN